MANFLEKVNNLVQGIGNNFGSKLGNLVTEIVRAPLKTTAAITLDTEGNTVFNPQTPLEKAIFGNEPIKSISSQFKEAQKTLQNSGLGKLSGPIAGTAVFGSAVLDLTPWGGSSKTLVKQIAKETSPELVANILRKANVGEDIIKNYAIKLAETKDEKVIQSAIENISKIQKTTKPINQATKGVEPLAQEAKFVLTTPEQKLIQAINEAKPVRKTAEKLYTAERSKRAALGSQILEKGQGESAYYSTLSKLKGELPKPQFESTATKLEQTDIDSLFAKIQTSPQFDFWEKTSSSNALAKILGKTGGSTIPTEGELKLLQKVFGNEFVQAVLKKRNVWVKALDITTEILNIPRAFLSSFDLSAPLRQGLIFTTTKPKQAVPAFFNMFKQAFSPKYFDKSMEEILSGTKARVAKESGLFFSDITGTSIKLSSKEEQFMTNVAAKIPILGAPIRASERGYIGFLNKLRYDVFDSLTKGLEKQGKTFESDPALYKAFANYVNTATGRGGLGKFESSAQILNNIFFSPRLMASRFNMLNPVWYMKQPPEVRKEAIKNMVMLIGTGLTVLSLAKLAGAEVSTDYRSSDFGKIKIGNTRWDPWGGFQQWARFISYLITGPKEGTTQFEGSAFGQNRLDKAINFFFGKLAPVPSFITDWMRGQDLLGNKFDIKEQTYGSLLPLYIQDIVEAIKEQGISGGISVGVPAFFGIGTQTYKQQGKSFKDKFNSLLK
jgi:hypothetical protein